MHGHLEKARRSAFFNDFARTHDGCEARLEIIGRAFGDQEEAAWLPLSGISYDPHHNLIFIRVGGINSRYPVHLTHAIDQPRMLHVRQTPEGQVSSLLIAASDKTEVLVHLRQQPRLTG